MASVTKYELPAARTPQEGRVTPFSYTLSLLNGDAAAADTITVFTPLKGAILVGCAMRVSATLGVGTTLQLQQGTVNLTGASTAAAASGVAQNSAAAAADGTEKVQLLVAGGGVTAAADVIVSGLMILPNG